MVAQVIKLILDFLLGPLKELLLAHLNRTITNFKEEEEKCWSFSPKK
jgi:hypothetical protein